MIEQTFTDGAERPKNPDIVWCPHCKRSFERPMNQLTVQCPNDDCRAMVVVGKPTFTRSGA